MGRLFRPTTLWDLLSRSWPARRGGSNLHSFLTAVLKCLKPYNIVNFMALISVAVLFGIERLWVHSPHSRAPILRPFVSGFICDSAGKVSSLSSSALWQNWTKNINKKSWMDLTSYDSSSGLELEMILGFRAGGKGAVDLRWLKVGGGEQPVKSVSEAVLSRVGCLG